MALTDSLISLWELEEVSGTRVDAVTASGNDLTDNNTVTRQTGKVGSCGQFTAANVEYLSHTDNASLSIANIDFSVCAWVYADVLGGEGVIISKYDADGGPREYYLEYNGSRFAFGAYNSSNLPLGEIAATTFGAVTTSTWYFVAAGYIASSNVKWISINAGVADSSVATSGRVPFDGASGFKIGARNTAPVIGSCWNGRIDQVGFWKRNLAAGDLTQLYNGGNGMSYAAMSGGFMSQSLLNGLGAGGRFFNNPLG